MILKTGFLFVLLLYIVVSVYPQMDSNLYLGVLETKWAEWPEEVFQMRADSARKKIVRVLFSYENNHWHTLENQIADTNAYPSQATWFISFDGKLIDSLNSTKAPLRYESHPWTFPRDSYHIPDYQALPTIGLPTGEFIEFAGEPHPRPLVVVSGSNYHDPDKWKPFTPHDSLMSKVYTGFLHYHKLSTENVIGPMATLDFGKSYKSYKSNILLQVGLKESTHDGREYLSLRTWFYLSKGGELINLSKCVDFPHRGTEDMEISRLVLVDAGDYDADGYTDVLFWISRYNGNGYALFYNDFTQNVTFEWSYH